MANAQPVAGYLALVSGRRRGPGASLLRGGLWAASWLYRAVMAARRIYYRVAARRLALPVVSVGNLTVGGTGKTPLVALVACRLVALGHFPVIASRGYKRAAGRASGDETADLRRHLPPSVRQVEAADRYSALLQVVRTEPHDVAILDDGFQHLRLRRDLDLVVIDATQPFGHGYCLPRGLLREPASALRRAHAVVLTRSDQATADALASIERTARRYLPPEAPVLRAVHRPTQLLLADGEAAPLEAVHGRACYLFCGLGNPEAFRRTADNLGAIVVGSRDFADHHPYAAADVDAVADAARAAGAEWILTTTKDFAKAADNELRTRWPDPAHTAAVEIELSLTDGDEALDELLRPLVGVAQQGETSREEP